MTVTDNKPQDATPIIAYKGMNKDFACTGGKAPFQYEVGKTYEHAGKVVRCASGGFHACESPFDVWNYYGLTESRFALVELSGEISRGSGDSKVAAGRITVKAELKLSEIISAGIKFLMGACKTESVNGEVSSGDCAQIGSSGDYAQIGSSGDSAKIGSSGDSAQIGSSGDSAQIGSSGHYAKIGSSGDYAQIGSSGDYAKIGSSGYSAQIGSSGDSAQIGSSGDYAKIEATGKNTVIACAGRVRRFKLGEDGCITVPYSDGTRTRFAVGYVGESLKADTWYSVSESGEFVESPE